MVATPPKNGTDFLKSLSRQAAAAKPQQPACDLPSALRSEVEAWLNEFGVKWTGPAPIDLSSIDVKGSRGHNSRESAVVEDTVQGVVVSINEKRPIKPIVVFVQGNRATIIDGNNRDEGHRRAGCTQIDAYVVDADTPSATLARMIIAANAHHPQRPDLAHRVKQAEYLVTTHGISTQQACRDANIKVEQLNQYRRLIEADKRASDLKIAGWFPDRDGNGGLPDTSRRALHRIPMDVVFHAAARVAVDTGMTSTEVEELSIAVRKVKSEAEQLNFLGAEKAKAAERERARKAGSRIKNDPKANLAQGIGKVTAVDPIQLAQSCMTDIDRRAVLDRINEALDHLARLEAALSLKKVGSA